MSGVLVAATMVQVSIIPLLTNSYIQALFQLFIVCLFLSVQVVIGSFVVGDRGESSEVSNHVEPS